MANGRRARRRVQVPPEQQVGVYAHSLGIWHTPHEFTLDFMVQEAPVIVPGAEDAPPPVQRLRVAARVRVPPTVLFELIRAVNHNLGLYEERFGKIRRPGEDLEAPTYPPVDWLDEDGSAEDLEDAAAESGDGTASDGGSPGDGSDGPGDDADPTDDGASSDD